MANRKKVPVKADRTAKSVKTENSGRTAAKTREDKTVLQKRSLMTSTLVNGLILYAVFVFFLNKGSIKISSIKLSFGIIGLYIGSVYLRFVLNNIKGRKRKNTLDILLTLLGPVLIAIYIAGILGKIFFFN